MNRLGWSLAAGWVVVSLGCVSAIPHPTSADAELAKARFAGVTLEQLEAGRSAYVAGCAGCHQLYVPSHTTPDGWPAIVRDMAARANMKSEEADRVTQYLVTMSARKQAP